MSGSPVFFKNNSYYKAPMNYTTGNFTLVKLVGIYSAQNHNSELGNVISLEKVIERLSKTK